MTAGMAGTEPLADDRQQRLARGGRARSESAPMSRTSWTLSSSAKTASSAAWSAGSRPAAREPPGRASHAAASGWRTRSPACARSVRARSTARRMRDHRRGQGAVGVPAGRRGRPAREVDRRAARRGRAPRRAPGTAPRPGTAAAARRPARSSRGPRAASRTPPPGRPAARGARSAADCGGGTRWRGRRCARPGAAPRPGRRSARAASLTSPARASPRRAIQRSSTSAVRLPTAPRDGSQPARRA